MSKVLSLIKDINHNPDLTANEKVVGVTLILGYVWGQNRARMRKDTLVQRTGLSARTVERATRGLCDKGVFTRKITGRATMFTIHNSILSSVLVGSPSVANHNDICGESKFAMTAEEWHISDDDDNAAEYLNGIK